jgi:hypothetical protein
MIDQKQPENAEYFNYLGSLITNDAKCKCEIKSTLCMVKVPADNFHKQTGLKIEETSQMLHLEHSFIWC